MRLAGIIDHTILKPDCSMDEIKRLCAEAVKYEFKAVCIPPFYIKEAAQLLEKVPVKVAGVIGFPMGYSATAAKVEEIKRAINDGADELDVVINICAVKSGNWNYVRNDIDSMTLATHSRGKVIKVIIETGLLSTDEIKKLCGMCSQAGVDFVKTSTGFNAAGANVETVEFLRANLPASIKIKASGGIRSVQDAERLVAAGADRLGSSAGVQIVSSAG